MVEVTVPLSFVQREAHGHRYEVSSSYAQLLDCRHTVFRMVFPPPEVDIFQVTFE